MLTIAPGMLSDRPVETGLAGAGVGFSATLLAAGGAYLWRSYVTPYRHVRRLIVDDASRPVRP